MDKKAEKSSGSSGRASAASSSAVVKPKDGQMWRDLTAYWILGLCEWKIPLLPSPSVESQFNLLLIIARQQLWVRGHVECCP